MPKLPRRPVLRDQAGRSSHPTEGAPHVRGWVTTDDDVRSALSVSWFPADLADSVPELLSTDPAQAATIGRRIEEMVGPMRHCRDYVEARAADAREAGYLQLPIGSPILAGTYLHWSTNDPDLLIEYGEYVLPPKKVLSWDYDVDDMATEM
ncbi:UTRA domain-containing protein [Frankia sp. Cr1]|uniref:UTRA domain-containing protein n=1 Tax=Frankia sp. Cr1 TaxID=3073931 RepID=UPI002AD3D8C7|nr:UTRA domain-containing protein [Frankia sp. Cr1]